eukprot:scaffold98418_cov69-Phaeocystis_antarctica.AAC.4
MASTSWAQVSYKRRMEGTCEKTAVHTQSFGQGYFVRCCSAALCHLHSGSGGRRTGLGSPP